MSNNILEKLAGNKMIANLAFKQIRKYIKDGGVSMICIYVDGKGDIAAKEYTDPVVVIKQDEYAKLLNLANKITHERNIE